MCKLSNFEPYAAFQRIDRGAKGHITARDVEKYMRDDGNSKGKLCEYGDSYDSGTNPHFLTVKEIRDLVESEVGHIEA